MLTYIHWNPDGTIVDLGFYALRWYSVLFALGFVLSYLILRVHFKKAGLGEEKLEKLTVYVVVAAIIGMRLGHCLFYDWDYYSENIAEIFLPVRFEPEFRFVGYQGLASHGGIFAILIALILYVRNYKIRLMWLLDKLALVGPLAGAFIRFGNLMNSEIIGKPADVPWAFVFEQVDRLPRHPGQLYEAIAYLLIFAFLNILAPRIRRENGFLVGLMLLLLFSARFIIEFFKADQSDFEAGMLLNMGQLLSIPFIMLGIVLVLIKRGSARVLEDAPLSEQNSQPA
jgi:phosphatidylglycerol:prolipoprotein diacylglycerol transferase